MVRLTAGFEDVCESFISGLAEIFLSQYYFFCSSEMNDDWECFADSFA
jgi:hypothetical protein